MRLRGQLVLAAAAIGTALLTVTVTVTAAQAGTGSAAAATPTPGGTLSDIITPSRTSGPTVNISPFPPDPPTNVTVTQVTTHSITVSWSPSKPGCCTVEGYDISYREIFNDLIWGLRVGPVTTGTVTSDIGPNRQYLIFVSARDGLGHQSQNSVGIDVMTPAADTGDMVAPPPPSALRVVEATPGAAHLAWTPPADTSDVAGYNIYGYDGLFSSTLLGTSTDPSFTAPISSIYYRFYVRSRDAAGNLSLASNVVTTSPGTGQSSSPPTSVSPSPPPGLSCRVSYQSTEWPGGFVASIALTNTGGTPVEGWSLTYRFGGDQQITGSWGGTATQSGALVTFTNAPWNSAIAGGATVYLGAQGTWHTGHGPPSTFALNGSACVIG